MIYFLVRLHEKSAESVNRFMNRKNYSLICKLLDDGDFYDNLISIKRKLDMDVKTRTLSDDVRYARLISQYFIVQIIDFSRGEIC